MDVHVQQNGGMIINNVPVERERSVSILCSTITLRYKRAIGIRKFRYYKATSGFAYSAEKAFENLVWTLAFYRRFTEYEQVVQDIPGHPAVSTAGWCDLVHIAIQ